MAITIPIPRPQSNELYEWQKDRSFKLRMGGGGAKQYAEYKSWRKMLKQLCQYLRDGGLPHLAVQLRNGVDLYRHDHAPYSIYIDGSVYHIFVSALQNYDRTAYMRFKYRAGSDGWLAAPIEVRCGARQGSGWC